MRHYRYKLRYTKEMLSLPRPVKLISLIIFIYYLGWGIIVPYFPIYLRELFGNYTSVGLITGLLPLIAVFIYLVIGPLVDRVSKKNIISLMLLFYLPLSYILLSLKTVIGFVYFRVYHAFIATSLWASTDSYLRVHSPKGKAAEAIGLFDSSFTLSLIIGPIIGAFLITIYSWNIFYAVSIFAFIAFLVSFILPDHKKETFISGLRHMFKDHFVKKEFSDFINNKQLVRFSAFMFFFYLATSVISLAIPLFLRSIGTDLFKIGLISSLFNLPWLFESYFSVTKNKKRLVLTALFFATLFLVLLFFAKDLYILAIILFVLGLSLAAVLPIMQGRITELMPKKEIGELVGVNSSIWNIATGFGPLLGGILADSYGLRYLYLLSSIIFLILLFVAYASKSFGFEEKKISDGASKL